MNTERRGHGFEDIDAQTDPSSWIDVLDRVRSEEPYARYKARVAELLDPQPGGKYLEVGTGAGVDALALAERYKASVVGIDSSERMIQEARRRGLKGARVADAHELPFEPESFDGAWADRTFQHLADPDAALREMVRVTKVGGRIVVVDPDYDTQVVNVRDQEVARRILHFRAEHGLRNGTLAHQMSHLFTDVGLSDIQVEAVPVVVRDPTALDNVMGLRDWAKAAHERELLDRDDVERWKNELDAAITGGFFLYAFSIFITSGKQSETA